MRSPILTGAPPVGLILAGGPGTRIGGGKPNVALHGEPLLGYPLRAMHAVLRDVAVITKPHVVLPRLERTMVWVEPERPLHPLFGICEALALAGGRAVLACAADMPFVTPALLGALAEAPAAGRPAVLAACGGVARPLLGRYLPASAPLLAQAARRQLPLEEAVRALRPTLVEVTDQIELFDVDTPDDLLQAAGMLDLRRPARP